MLVLFDIDGTLLLTGGLGRKIMQEAGLAMLSRAINIDALEFAGRLDPLILTDLLTLNGVEATEQSLLAMRTHYVDRMTHAIADSGQVRVLPGAHELVRAVGELPGVTLGVLTGNYAETGRAKLEAAGWRDDAFEISVWGDESPNRPHSRDQLPGVAIERCSAARGEAFTGERVVVIGDTVHDVACARAHGCRAVGVSTGNYPSASLAESGADLVVESLVDTARVVGQIEAWMAS